MTHLNAAHVDTNRHGVELRFASLPEQVWPGWDASTPLGKRGYWAGDHRQHIYLGLYPEDARPLWATVYGGDPDRACECGSGLAWGRCDDPYRQEPGTNGGCR